VKICLTNKISTEPAKANGSAEIQQDRDTVRKYSVESSVEAIREGDTHVITIRGIAPDSEWTKRVPAERTAVLTGERLWTVPDNWARWATIKESEGEEYHVYHIPETDVEVLVGVPDKIEPDRAWYEVRRVGKLSVSYDDEIAWGKLERKNINAAEVASTLGSTVGESLRILKRYREPFTQRLAKVVKEHGKESLLGPHHDPVTVEDWSTTIPIGALPNPTVSDLLCVGLDTEKEIIDYLVKTGVLPTSLRVTIDVSEKPPRPDGYALRALGEVGASDAEIVDYLTTEYHNLMTQTEWAELRERGENAVANNVDRVKESHSE